MKIALLGYGKMGREIHQIALERDHTLELIIDIDNQYDLTVENLMKAEVAIDFSVPASAYNNISLCFDAGIPVVSGTTGWLDKLDAIVQRCEKENRTFFYASNFSLGVNIFFHLNRQLAKMMNGFPEYEAKIKEIHHVQKLDAPSGTAITLAKDIIGILDRKSEWALGKASDNKSVVIQAIREGSVPGTHIITYDSEIDSLEIRHEAKSRKGFALGAVLAAEFIRNRKGRYTMDDLLKFSE